MAVYNSKAPCRLSFAGGGTDIDSFARDYGGCVVSVAIARYARAIVDTKGSTIASFPVAQSDVELLTRIAAYFAPCGITSRVDAPPRSGLGASGALSVAVIGCLNALKDDEPLTLMQIADLAHRIEIDDLKVEGGRQDQVAAAYGGLNYIEFGDGRINVSPIAASPDTLAGLEAGLILVFTRPRITNSGNIMEKETHRVETADPRTLLALDRQKEIANEMRRCLRHELLSEFGLLLDYAWEIKKIQTPEATDQAIDDLYKAAKDAGALGGKISGAGGGGYMTLFAPGKEGQVAEAVLKMGYRPEAVHLDMGGLKVWRSL